MLDVWYDKVEQFDAYNEANAKMVEIALNEKSLNPIYRKFLTVSLYKRTYCVVLKHPTKPHRDMYWKDNSWVSIHRANEAEQFKTYGEANAKMVEIALDSNLLYPEYRSWLKICDEGAGRI